jgi:hypothetical protein
MKTFLNVFILKHYFYFYNTFYFEESHFLGFSNSSNLLCFIFLVMKAVM